MDAIIVRRHWFHLTPDRLIVGLLAVEAVLFFSERFRWFPFNAHKGWTVLIAVAAVGVFSVFLFLRFVVALVFRGRFQFSIRSLLVLTLVVALPCSWLSWQMTKAREQKEAVEAIRKLWGVGHDGEMVDYAYDSDASENPVPTVEPPEPLWLRNLLGGDFFLHAVSLDLDHSQGTDGVLEHLKELPHLKVLDLSHTQITDAGLKNLIVLPQLQVLHLHHTQITDAGLKHLIVLPRLQVLRLDDTNTTDSGLRYLERLTQLEILALDAKVTDAGLLHLAGLTDLQELSLDNAQVTDVGLEHLKGLRKLLLLGLEDTKVTDAGVKKLQKALPKCGIAR